MALTITTENFGETVMDSDLPVMLDFWAPWCGPCRTLGPVIEKLADKFEGRAIVGKVNVDEETDLAGEFKVLSIPSVFILKDGEVVERLVGARIESELSELLERYT
jgi:thioredoxin 1